MDEPNLIAVSRKITSFARSVRLTITKHRHAKRMKCQTMKKKQFFSVSHGHFIQRDSKNSEPVFAINEGSDESAHM